MSAPPDLHEPLPSPTPGPTAAPPAHPGAPQLQLPADMRDWGQRFGAGAHLMWHLFGVLRSQPAVWRRYLKVCILQAAVTLGVALLVMDKSGLSDMFAAPAPPPPPLPRISAPLAPVALGAPSLPRGAATEPATPPAPVAEDAEAADEAADEAAEEALLKAEEARAEAEAEKLAGQIIAQAMRKAFEPKGARAPEGAAPAPEGPAGVPLVVPPVPPVPGVPAPARDARKVAEARVEADAAQRLASLARTQAVLQQLQLRMEARDSEGARAAAAQLRAAVASMRADARKVDSDEAKEDLEKVARRARQVERLLERDPTAGAIAAGALLEDVGERVVQAGAEIEEAEEALHQKDQTSRWRRLLALLASLYATLFAVQYVVLAFSREYHDAITRQLSLAVGLEPEDPDVPPRLHLDLRWVRTKMVRRVRSFIAFLPGLVLAAVLSSLASIAMAFMFPFFKKGAGALVSQALTFVWAAYWWTVFTAGKSARAWTEEGRAPPPAFLRRLEALTQSSPLFRWWGPRLFCRMALACSRSFYSPAAAVDRRPLEFAGLAAARALALVPLFKLFVRPVAPVASAQLLAAQGLTFPTARPVRDATARDARGD